MGERDAGEPRYTAFLSYSHKDAAAAGRLHRRLETYRIPKRLVGTETARGTVPERLWPIFRDRDELPAATDLSETVREALARSGALIILCSPHSAGSLWVAEEIDVFRRLHPDRPILATVLDGDPPDCFPAALRALDEAGIRHEPLATDLRSQGDGLHLGLLKLVAGITGVALDALVQRDASRRVRRVMAVTGAALIAMLVMAAMALFALDARREAERQRVEAELQRADAEELIEFMLTDLRDRLRGVGRLEVMTTVNAHALAFYDRQMARGAAYANSAMRARVLHAIGEDLDSRRDARGAMTRIREAYQVTSRLMARAPNDPDNIFAHAQSEYWLGYFAYFSRNFAETRHRFQNYRDLVDRLLRVDPDNVAWLREAGYAQGNLCSLALAPPIDRAAALNHCRIALRHIERAHRLRGDDPPIVADLANRHVWIADAWNENGRWDRALQHRARQEALLRSLIESDPDNADYLDRWMRMHFTMGQLLARHGSTREARPHFLEAATTAAKLSARDPQNSDWREWVGRTARAAAGS